MEGFKNNSVKFYAAASTIVDVCLSKNLIKGLDEEMFGRWWHIHSKQESDRKRDKLK